MSKYGTVRKFEINIAFQNLHVFCLPSCFCCSTTRPRWELSTSTARKQQRSLTAEMHRQGRETKKLSPSINTSLVQFVLETNRSFNVDRRFQINLLRCCSHADHAISITLHYTCARQQFKSSKTETSRIDLPGQRRWQQDEGTVVKLVLLFCVVPWTAQRIRTRRTVFYDINALLLWNILNV